MGFSDFGWRVQRFVETHHNPQANGLGACSGPDGAQNIHGTVGTGVAGAAHGGGCDDGFGTVVKQVQKVTGFFQRIGSVRNDGTGNIIASQDFFKFDVQVPHVLRGHGRRSDVGKLNELQRSNICELRNGGGQVFTRTGRHKSVFFRIVFHGNGAARCNNDYFLVNHQKPLLKL